MIAVLIVQYPLSKSLETAGLGDGMLPESRTTLAGVVSRLNALLTFIAIGIGVATYLVSIYGGRQEVEIRTEIARMSGKRQAAEKDVAVQKARIETEAALNAEQLEKAKAAKAVADAKAAAALADNAHVKQEAEAKYAAQKAVIEAAIARYAERMKRTEADKLRAEAVSAEEVAKNSDVKFKAEAEKATLDALEIEHKANIQAWIANCARATGSISDCSIKWSCLRDKSVLC